MKKTLAIIMVAVMLFAMLVPVSAVTSPVKDVATAKKGELLYTFNFKGDAAFQPKELPNSTGNMEYIISPDGSALQIKSKAGGTSKVRNHWGGLVEGLTCTEESIYTMTYEAKANGTAGKNNSVGIGGWAVKGEVDVAHVYNNYGNHNTVDASGSNKDQRSSLSYDSGKLASTITTKTDNYVYTKDFDYDVNKDGFVTMMIVFDGVTAEFQCYMLAKGATDITKESSWILVEENTMANAVLNPGQVDNMCFWTYAYYNPEVDTTIRNAKIYKDRLWAKDEVTTAAPTTAPTTTAPVTTAPVTTAPVTTAPATDDVTTAAPEAKGGCGGTVTVAGLALVAALGTCAVFVEKKRK